METEKHQQDKLDYSQMWEGLYYLSFFIFFILVVIPRLPAALTLNAYYPIAMAVYGTIGVFTGIGVYRLVRNASDTLKWSIITVIYIAVVYQLLTHVERFMVPD